MTSDARLPRCPECGWDDDGELHVQAPPPFAPARLARSILVGDGENGEVYECPVCEHSAYPIKPWTAAAEAVAA